MIKVSMGEKNGIDCTRIETKILGIFLFNFPSPLEEATVDKNTRMIGLEKMARTRYLAGCTMAG